MEVDLIGSMTKRIEEFRGPYKFLSNFYIPAQVVYEGITYPSSEHAFQAAKSVKREERIIIRDLCSPREAKAQGKLLKLRRGWEEMKRQVMYDVVLKKFCCNPHLLDKLLKTEGAYLVEGNWWGDKYWGVHNGEGENWLGQILMKIRDEVIQIYEGGKLVKRPVVFKLEGIVGAYDG